MFPTHYHISTYLIGILVACKLHHGLNFNIKSSYKTLLWIVLSSSCFLMLLPIYYWNKEPDNVPSALLAALYYIFCNQILWPAFLIWIIINCVQGNIPFINHILSLKLYIPLGRLNYAIYLSQFTIIHFRLFNERQNLLWDEYYLVSQELIVIFKVIN